jgi:4-carboxymuconolactone decarboxylase
MKLPATLLAMASLAASAQADERKPAPRMAPPDVRATVPALADYTDEVLFADVWARPGLAPRDRSLVTIAALIATGQTAQLTGHLNRGIANGLTREQLSEVITHLAFYAGWPRAMSAVPVAKSVFEARGLSQSEATGPATQGSTTLDIVRHDSTPAQPGPAEYFTGTVRIASRFQRADPARVGGAIVSFEAGARTAWHTHPLGQTLIVTAGQGWVQREGGPVEDIRPGDVVWIPPGEKHWHGATATTAMTHVAISESLDGRSVDWLEHVTDAQYGAR